MIQALYRANQYFHKALALNKPLPNWAVNMCEPQWPFLTYEMRTQYFGIDIFLPGVETLHFRSETDPFYEMLRMDRHFENPLVVEFRGGHRPPKMLSVDGLKETAQFFYR